MYNAHYFGILKVAPVDRFDCNHFGLGSDWQHAQITNGNSQIYNLYIYIFFFFERHSSSLVYPYPSSFSFWDSHLLPGQDLDVISIPFQIYFIQATTTRFLEPVKLQWSSFWFGSLGKYNLITGFITAKAIGSQGGYLLFTQVDLL